MVMQYMNAMVTCLSLQKAGKPKLRLGPKFGHNVLFGKTMEGNVKAIHCNIEIKMYTSCMKGLKTFVFVQISSSFTSSSD